MRAALLLLVSACRLTGTFECGIDEACRRDDELGKCEVEGYCSFGDADCASGRRFAENAGGGLANDCVDETAVPLTCLERWKTNVLRFDAVNDLGVSTAEDDRDPWLSAAGTTVVFSSNRPVNGQTTTGFDIYLAQRPDFTSAFAAPTLVGALSGASQDSHVTFSADLLTVYLNSNRMGTAGGSDIWRATRTTATGTFSTADKATVDNVNSADEEFDAFLSTSGLHLYFARSKSGQPQHLMLASRDATTDAFGAPVAIAELDNASTADPTLSPDELLMVFTSTRTAPTSGTNLWYTTRATVTEKWLPPRLVPDINIDGDEGDAFLSADGCLLVFSRAAAPAGPRDIVYAGVAQ